MHSSTTPDASTGTLPSVSSGGSETGDGRPPILASGLWADRASRMFSSIESKVDKPGALASRLAWSDLRGPGGQLAHADADPIQSLRGRQDEQERALRFLQARVRCLEQPVDPPASLTPVQGVTRKEQQIVIVELRETLSQEIALEREARSAASAEFRTDLALEIRDMRAESETSVCGLRTSLEALEVNKSDGLAAQESGLRRELENVGARTCAQDLFYRELAKECRQLRDAECLEARQLDRRFEEASHAQRECQSSLAEAQQGYDSLQHLVSGQDDLALELRAAVRASELHLREELGALQDRLASLQELIFAQATASQSTRPRASSSASDATEPIQALSPGVTPLADRLAERLADRHGDQLADTQLKAVSEADLIETQFFTRPDAGLDSHLEARFAVFGDEMVTRIQVERELRHANEVRLEVEKDVRWTQILKELDEFQDSFKSDVRQQLEGFAGRIGRLEEKNSCGGNGSRG